MNLFVRMSVGAPVGTDQVLVIQFETNDPRRPIGSCEIVVPRVTSIVQLSVPSIVIGELPINHKYSEVVTIHDGGSQPVFVKSVTCKHPQRVAVRMLDVASLGSGESIRGFGLCRARIECVANTNVPGTLDTELEVQVVAAVERVVRIPITGNVESPFLVLPSVIYLPRFVDGKRQYSASAEIVHRGGKLTGAELLSVPPGLSITITGVQDGRACLSISTDAVSKREGAPHRQSVVRVRVRADNVEALETLEVSHPDETSH
jgi:hypothetical protein